MALYFEHNHVPLTVPTTYSSDGIVCGYFPPDNVIRLGKEFKYPRRNIVWAEVPLTREQVKEFKDYVSLRDDNPSIYEWRDRYEGKWLCIPWDHLSDFEALLLQDIDNYELNENLVSEVASLLLQKEAMKDYGLYDDWLDVMHNVEMQYLQHPEELQEIQQDRVRIHETVHAHVSLQHGGIGREIRPVRFNKNELERQKTKLLMIEEAEAIAREMFHSFVTTRSSDFAHGQFSYRLARMLSGIPKLVEPAIDPHTIFDLELHDAATLLLLFRGDFKALFEAQRNPEFFIRKLVGDCNVLLLDNSDAIDRLRDALLVLPDLFTQEAKKMSELLLF